MNIPLKPRNSQSTIAHKVRHYMPLALYDNGEARSTINPQIPNASNPPPQTCQSLLQPPASPQSLPYLSSKPTGTLVYRTPLHRNRLPTPLATTSLLSTVYAKPPESVTLATKAQTNPRVQIPLPSHVKLSFLINYHYHHHHPASHSPQDHTLHPQSQAAKERNQKKRNIQNVSSTPHRLKPEPISRSKHKRVPQSHGPATPPGRSERKP